MKFQILIKVVLISNLLGCNLLREPLPPIEVSAAQLAADYKENSAAANKKYEGQALIINGVISHYAEIRGTVGVYLERSNPISDGWVFCPVYKSSQPDIYSKLNRGKNVTIAGTVEYQEDNSFITITDCEVR